MCNKDLILSNYSTRIFVCSSFSKQLVEGSMYCCHCLPQAVLISIAFNSAFSGKSNTTDAIFSSTQGVPDLAEAVSDAIRWQESVRISCEAAN